MKEQQKVVEGLVRSVNLTGLLPYTTYVVTIRSFTRKGSSIQSRSVEGRTLEGGDLAFFTPLFGCVLAFTLPSLLGAFAP